MHLIGAMSAATCSIRVPKANVSIGEIRRTMCATAVPMTNRLKRNVRRSQG